MDLHHVSKFLELGHTVLHFPLRHGYERKEKDLCVQEFMKSIDLTLNQGTSILQVKNMLWSNYRIPGDLSREEPPPANCGSLAECSGKSCLYVLEVWNSPQCAKRKLRATMRRVPVWLKRLNASTAKIDNGCAKRKSHDSRSLCAITCMLDRF